MALIRPPMNGWSSATDLAYIWTKLDLAQQYQGIVYVLIQMLALSRGRSKSCRDFAATTIAMSIEPPPEGDELCVAARASKVRHIQNSSPYHEQAGMSEGTGLGLYLTHRR